MSKEIIMADAVSTEVPQPAGEAVLGQGGVATESSISPEDRDRLQRAGATLGIQLDSGQGEAILEAHKVGEGEKGKDGGQAAVGNYTLKQLGNKLKILEGTGFS